MDHIKKFFEGTELDCVLVRKTPLDVNFSYFTKLPLDYFDSALLVLKRDKKPVVFVSSLEYKWLANRKDLVAKEIKKREEFRKELKKEISEKTVGLNKHELTSYSCERFQRMFKGKHIVNVSKELDKLREIKDKEEIDCIRKAGDITSKAFNLIPEFVRDRLTEREAVIELEYFMKKNGADNVAFPPIVASGKNAGIPHFIPSGKRIEKGFLLVDIGARYKNYCSDMSRTFYVGKANEKEKEIYAVVLNAKKQAEGLLERNGNVSAKKLHLAAEKELKKAGFELVHSVGHGVGLQAHDVPVRLNAKANFKLKKGMVFTLEPGIYNNKMGIRIEDTYLKTKKGFEKLGKFSEKLIEI